MNQTAIAPEQDRSSTLEQLRTRDVYPGMDAAWRQLAADPNDAEMRDRLVAALNGLGLSELGAHVVRGFAGPSGAIPWGTRRSLWSENLKALQSRYPQLAAELRAQWNSCRITFELYRCRDGNFQIRVPGPDGPGVWLPNFGDHRRAAAEVAAPGGSFASGNSGLIHGIYLGWLINRVFAETARVYLEFSCPIYLLAPSGAELAAAMHLHDWRELLSDRRVQLFAGPDCIDQLERFLGDNPLYPVPAWRLTQPSWDDTRVGELNDAIQRLTNHRRDATLKTWRRMQLTYGGRDVTYWAERYTRRDREPLRVLGIVSRHSTFIRGSMEECLRALQSLGCACRLLTESKSFFLGNSPRELHEVQTEFEPDLILMIDNYRGQMPGMLTPDVPLVMWIQDALGRLICPEAGRAMGPLDFAIGYARRDCVEACEYPADGFLECDVPTGFSRELAVTPEWRERHSCDVSFVSTASKPPEQIHADRRNESPPELHPLIDAIYEKVRSMLSTGQHLCFPRRLLAETMRETGIEIADSAALRDLETWYVFRLFDWGFRQEALRWTAHWAHRTGRRFHLYGRGWESFPELGEFARGHLWERDEVAAVHHLSRVNLQLFAITALHQRTYDVLGAGGTVLFRRSPIDYRDDELAEVEARLGNRGATALNGPDRDRLAELIGHHFEDAEEARARLDNGKPLTWKPGECAASRHPCLKDFSFGSAEKLETLLDRYLENDSAREDASKKLRESILPSSTYGARMNEMLEFLGRRLRLRARYGCRGYAPLRGPEAHTTAKICVRRSAIPAARPEHALRLNRAVDQLCGWIRATDSSCEIDEIDAASGRPDTDREFTWLHERDPDLVIAFGRVRLLRGEFCGLRQLLIAPEFYGGTRRLAEFPGARFGGAVNFGADASPSRDAFVRWTELPADRVRTFCWPIDPEHDRANQEPNCDLSVSPGAIAPVSEMLRGWRERLPAATAKALTPVFDRIEAMRPDALRDAERSANLNLNSLYENVVADTQPDDEVARDQLTALRAFGLQRILDSWIQESRLVRLVHWARENGHTLRIAASQAWRTHESVGEYVVVAPPTIAPIHPRLHVGLGTGPVPPAADLNNIVAGVPTLLFQPVTRANGTENEMRIDATKEIAVANWDEWACRAQRHLIRPADLTEQTRAIARAIAPQLQPTRIIRDLLEWASRDDQPPQEAPSQDR